MRKVKPLKVNDVYNKCDLSKLGFKTTDDLGKCDDFIGQERAVKAIHFGLGVKSNGYNIYVAGPPGVGKTTVINSNVNQLAKKGPRPSDWCYVYNFADPSEPTSIELQTGKGMVFKKDMEELLTLLKTDLPRALESKDFEDKRQEVMNDFQRERSNVYNVLQKFASEENFQIQFTPTGIVTIPLEGGKPVSTENYNKLEHEKKEEIRKRKDKVDNEVAKAVKTARQLERNATEKVKKLQEKVALFAVRDIIESLKEKYKNNGIIIDYLGKLQSHVLENLEAFLTDRTQRAPGIPIQMPQQQPTFTEYKVNLFIDNSNIKGSPVINESHPNYNNLFGSIEKESRFGALITDFTMIRPGSLAKANGGYLILEAVDILKYPFVWDSLKKVLEHEELRIEDIYQQYGFSSTIGIRPEPIKINIKVIISGNSYLYRLLYAYDEDFRKLFKVKADFDTVLENNDKNLSNYACLIKSLCDSENLTKFQRSGVEAVIEYSSRLASNQSKLSVEIGSINKILNEASYWSNLENSDSVKRLHVEKAIEEKIYRSNMIEEKIQEMINKGFIMVDTDGLAAGQINGLAVYNIGDYTFGKPSRITCETFIGTDGLINIERRARLSGNIHDKGVLILSGYLGAKFAQSRPLSLSASLGFEQTYEIIDGDSASAAELIALLSSLSEVPIKQGLAITGSVNQKGQIQPIGGVNEKIEGFFDICKFKGLTGSQGAVIPHQNVRNLMLKKEIQEAVRKAQFKIYPVETIDQALEIMTGNESGTRGANGKFKRGTINYLVDNKLKELGESYRKFGKKENKNSKDTNNDNSD